MQERVTLLGQMEVYGQASQSIEDLLRVQVSTSQVYRLTDTYGDLIEGDLTKEFEAGPIEEKDIVYAEVDGSMIFTDDGWQEVKLGRVFKSKDIGPQSQNTERQSIKRSVYTAHLGYYADFLSRFEPSLLPYQGIGQRLVFISDGVRWFDKWVKDNYPEATQILDFYHAMEHLADIARLLISEEGKRKKWLENNKLDLLESRVDQVIKSIKQLRAQTPDQVDKKCKLIKYYRNNSHRMDYKTYKANNWHIGSGAIEAAHRTVIQARMKKSGQRWSNEGARRMLNLRTCFKSQRWKVVINKIKNGKSLAA